MPVDIYLFVDLSPLVRASPTPPPHPPPFQDYDGETQMVYYPQHSHDDQDDAGSPEKPNRVTIF